MKIKMATTIVLSFYASFTFANNVSLEKCSSIADNIARLACYDQLTTTQTAITQNPEQNVSNHNITEQKAIDTPSILESNTENDTPLSLQYDLNKNSPKGILSIRSYQPMYLLPIWYSSRPNNSPSSPTRGISRPFNHNINHLEAKMQISFKMKILQDIFKTKSDLWFGYTQTSNWQIYNHSISRPFRNTDYQPEFFITQPVNISLPAQGKLRMLGLGLNHQSNGRSEPESRSWNRIYAMAGMEWRNLTIIPRVWWRFPEKGEDNDNPNINHYFGYGDLNILYRFDQHKTLASTIRFNPKTNKGGLQLNYSFPISGKLKGYIQVFSGYGDNLLDYNHKNTSIGFGLLIDDWSAL